MATNGASPPDLKDSDLMNYVVRMVVPMRREFSRSLDVSHFLHDFTYAKEIIEQAKISNDARLREYAACLDKKMFGPRDSVTSVARESLPAQPQSKVLATPSASDEKAEADMRTRMLTKYKTGLR